MANSNANAFKPEPQADQTTGGPEQPNKTGPDNVRPIRQPGQPSVNAPNSAPGTADSSSQKSSGGGARGTAAMDPDTRQEVARKGGLAVSRNKEHMASIGRRGGQSVSKNREHMASIGRKGGAASRGSRGSAARPQQEQPHKDESAASPGLTTGTDRNRGTGEGTGSGQSSSG
jgi:general stress protein YciG